MTTLRLPVLPIPNVVFFPNTAIPIFVVEPVYIKMIKECIDSGLPLGISMAEPVNNHFNQVRYSPKVICSMGKPIILEELEDGSLKVLIKGQSRVRLLKVQQNLPYLIYEAEIIPEAACENGFATEGQITRLKELLDIWLEETICDSMERESFSQNIVNVNCVVDYLSMFLIQDREMRQLLLENVYLHERIQMLNSLLQGECPLYEDVTVANAIKSFEQLEKFAKVAH